MKNLLISATILLLFGTAFAQTKVLDQNGTLRITYTIPAQSTDSTTTLTSDAFSIPSDYLNNLVTNNGMDNVTFALKVPGNFGGKPETLIAVKGFYNGGSDSYMIDTLRTAVANQTTGDTAGITNFNNWAAETFQIQVTNSGISIGSGGFVELIFKKNEYLPSFNRRH